MIRLSRCFLLLILACFAGLFSDCSNQAKVQPDTFGELDSARIASDTAMEINMNLSYEYHKSLVQNDSTVYDFLAYDKPKGQNTAEWESKLIVIKRTKMGQDTIIKGVRSGPVQGLGLADLDDDGIPEIFFYENKTVNKNLWVVHIYKQKPDGKYEDVYWRQLDARSSPEHYRGRDTFFVYQSELMHCYPYYERHGDTLPKGNWCQKYKLHNGKMILENEKWGNSDVL